MRPVLGVESCRSLRRFTLQASCFSPLASELEGSNRSTLSKSVVLLVKGFLDCWQIVLHLVLDSGGAIGEREWLSESFGFLRSLVGRDILLADVIDVVELVGFLNETLGLHLDDLMSKAELAHVSFVSVAVVGRRWGRACLLRREQLLVLAIDCLG